MKRQISAVGAIVFGMSLFFLGLMSATRDRVLAANRPNKIEGLWDRVVRRIRSGREKRRNKPTDKLPTATV